MFIAKHKLSSKYFIYGIFLISGLCLFVSCFPETRQVDTKFPYYVSGEFDNSFFHLTDSNTTFGSFIPDQNMIVLKAYANNIEIRIQIYNIDIDTKTFPKVLPGDSTELSFAELKLTTGQYTPGIGGGIWNGSTRNQDELSIRIENISSIFNISGSYEGIIKDDTGKEIQVENGEFNLLLNEITL